MIELIAPYIGMGMALVFLLSMWIIAGAQEKGRHKHPRHKRN